VKSYPFKIITVVLWVISSFASAVAQSDGHLKGTVRNSSGGQVAGVVVVATNQVTSQAKETRTASDGSYSLKLSPGAYRLTVAPPNVAQFDKDKNYGDFIIVRGDRLENVIVDAGKDIAIDIVLAKPEEVQIPATPQRRETPDRWRIEFPEYDRYGDRGARGRDIPFKRGRWWNPYNQNVLKGDYPIKGDKLFMILSAVSTTPVEQRRAPTPSDVSRVEAFSAEFLDRR